MKYLVMLAIVIGLACADWLTGVIKAYVTNTISSKVMRVGGIKKLAEIIIQGVGIGIDLGIAYLAVYYPDNAILSGILSNITAIIVCGYITIMELVSILENFAAIYPAAAWVTKIAKKLSNIDRKDDDDDKA